METSHNQWHEMADAIGSVEDLAFDQQFAKSMMENHIYIESEFSQLNGPSLCVNNSELFRQSTLTEFCIEPHIVIRDVNFVVHRRGDFFSISGEVVINERQMTISSPKGNLLLSMNDDMPPFIIQPDDISNFLLSIVSAYIDEKPSEIEPILNAQSSAQNSWERLSNIVSQMGNLTGVSSQTIRSLFYSPNGGIIAELTDVETPDGSSVQNQLLLHRESDIWSDRIGFNHAETHPADPSMPPTHLAHKALALCDVADFHRSVTDENPFGASSGAIFAEHTEGTPTEVVRQYARLCMEFLESYRNFISKRP